ncbi:6-carboxytetrahydropterin synthase [Salinispirillum sp. LH 10-3-1]|uniref:6-carboxy-5,6,7,8-tetrahydropterin synthase n=1 Tax=Salinispirillum sp. LH 10-3-1 TaxID=2952525 RepID=A0AB38YBT4_9GAMM
MASLFVDALTVVDFSYLDAERGIVGESWIVDIELEGALNDEGMVFDFSHVKRAIKAEIDSGLDHRFVVPEHMPGLVIQRGPEESRLSLKQPQKGFVLDYRAPNEAFYWLDASAIKLADVTRHISAQVRQVVPANVSNIIVRLRPEEHDGAFYHYSHGLKKHQGDCQRMIHGHRSRIIIERDGTRDTYTEATLAEHWRDIYLITREDIQAECQVLDIPCYHVVYTAQQGDFELTLPKARCDILDTDTTVELIADHLAQLLHKQAPAHHWKVRAFEGVDKGAIAAC